MSIVAFYHKAPLKFRMDGCVKLAYPRGHDELLMIGLDNMKNKPGTYPIPSPSPLALK
jgi:hypothetical protein